MGAGPGQECGAWVSMGHGSAHKEWTAHTYHVGCGPQLGHGGDWGVSTSVATTQLVESQLLKSRLFSTKS